MREHEDSAVGKMSILFIILVLGYVGVEVYSLHKAKERMDPVNLLDQFTRADRATNQCGQPEASDVQRFQRNLQGATARATKALTGRNPQQSADEIALTIETRRTAAEGEVDAVIAAKGCGDREIRTLLRMYEIWARIGPG
jgi:hypothetical protein